MTGILAWLLNTKIGRTVLLCVIVAVSTLGSWYLFSSHYEKAGYAKCQAEHTAAQNKANVNQATKNEQTAAIGSELGQQTADKGAAVVKDADTSATSTKEDIHDVYKKPPTTAPVVLGSCVHPVDPRVQERIDHAVREANAAGGAL